MIHHRISRKFALLLLVTPLLTAMGTGGGPRSDTIPRPKERFRAELVDRQGVLTRVEHLSCDGKTFFPLERGEGTLMVPFAKTRRVSVRAGEGSQVAVEIQVDDADKLPGTLPANLVCTGETEYGNFRVDIGGLREIGFARSAP